MEKNLSLNEEINNIINRKLCNCNCNPCQCSEQTKDIYFQELKETLKNYNKDYAFHNVLRIDLLMKMNNLPNFSSTNK